MAKTYLTSLLQNSKQVKNHYFLKMRAYLKAPFEELALQTKDVLKMTFIYFLTIVRLSTPPLLGVVLLKISTKMQSDNTEILDRKLILMLRNSIILILIY